ncbi:uncharacterized protein MYCFIDRAFT_176158 [Pseudocercospora fijiensis CIRAD86]|uniref:Uncharacterized protein n=1 Tax=Pseudocercospora fijiensis (strain CIRAD86) TaxID=383855 RepID=M3AUH7_PSEFD|nr:uncharacterized protein MYCFIDRAFT_176158 [Pseudocercospora fijiensis CIRAD86]EME80778.1 hypothetical protein MYCFIDRAFT_176158 [Pseudocercospora fijiensis CIRAD86]
MPQAATAALLLPTFSYIQVEALHIISLPFYHTKLQCTSYRCEDDPRLRISHLTHHTTPHFIIPPSLFKTSPTHNLNAAANKMPNFEKKYQGAD